MVSLINQQHLDGFSQRLNKILCEEIKAGNQITETSKDWPEAGLIIVFLKGAFHKPYTIDGVNYHEINDRHYWKAEYVDSLTNDILACGF